MTTPVETLRRPTRILHLVESGGLYGIERMLLALLPALRDRGIETALGCFGSAHADGGKVGLAAMDLGIETIFLGDGAGFGARQALNLVRSLRSRRPALAHFHGYKATIIGGLVGKWMRVLGIATYHGEARQAVGLRRQLAIETPMLRRLRMVVGVSQSIAQELVGRGICPDRVRFIPNGLTHQVSPRVVDHQSFKIVVVGRLIREKNVQMVFKSIAALAKRWPSVRVLVAGEGAYRMELERLATELGIEDAVQFLGFVSDVPSILSCADAFVMPSQTEGMPMALLEAMASRVPIIASAVGSIPWVTRNGREAILVERNDQAALTSAIEQLLIDPAAAAARAKSAYSRFSDRFTADTMADAYTSLYQAILRV